MHDCKATKDELIELALSDARLQTDASIKLPACHACREELNSLRNTTQMTRAAMQLAEPGERFWSGYEARLRERIRGEAQSNASSLPARRSFPAMLRDFALASVPVPAPLALAIFGFVILAAVFMFYARKSASAPAVFLPSVVEKIVEVPVVHEKVITRVVYRSRESTPVLARESGMSRLRIADKQREESICMADGLEGFKPAHDARLTIIKGSYRDDK